MQSHPSDDFLPSTAIERRELASLGVDGHRDGAGEHAGIAGRRVIAMLSVRRRRHGCKRRHHDGTGRVDGHRDGISPSNDVERRELASLGVKASLGAWGIP